MTNNELRTLWKASAVRHVIGAALATCSLTLSSCRHYSPDSETVDYQAVVPLGAQRYELERDEVYFVGDLKEPATLPVFPAVPISDSSVDVCVEIDIDENGVVYSARELDLCRGETPAQAWDPLLSAALTAVQTWRFAPAITCRVRAGRTAENEDCAGADAIEVKAVPMRLAYTFTFLKRQGVARVSKGRTR